MRLTVGARVLNLQIGNAHAAGITYSGSAICAQQRTKVYAATVARPHSLWQAAADTDASASTREHNCNSVLLFSHSRNPQLQALQLACQLACVLSDGRPSMASQAENCRRAGSKSIACLSLSLSLLRSLSALSPVSLRSLSALALPFPAVCIPRLPKTFQPSFVGPPTSSNHSAHH